MEQFKGVLVENLLIVWLLSILLLQNFHLMDYHLVTFITVMLARRLVWTIVSEVNTQTCPLTHFITHKPCGNWVPDGWCFRCCSLSDFCVTVSHLSCQGVSEQQWISASLCGPDHGPALPADLLWLGALLDISQPLQEPLCAQPPIPGIPVSLWSCHSLKTRVCV